MPMRPPHFFVHEFSIPSRGRVYHGYTVDPPPQPPPKREVPSVRTLIGERLLVDKMVGTTTGKDKEIWMKAQRYLSMGWRIEVDWKRAPLPDITIHK